MDGGVLQLVEPVAAAARGALPAEERAEDEGERRGASAVSLLLEAEERRELRLLARERPVGVAEAIARPAQAVEAGGLRRLGVAERRPAPRP